MLSTGLVSVTFRSLDATAVTRFAAQAGLDGIEWGGDIHVPPGNVKNAQEVRWATLDAGLVVAAYGSYYRLGQEEKISFGSVLETAVTLGAPLIRIWAGDRGSALAEDDYFAMAVEDSRRIADMAKDAGVVVAYEYHGDTLTDTAESALRLLKEVNHPNIKTLWQPPVGMDVDDCLNGLNSVLDWVTNVHVFQWGATSKEKYPLADGQSAWSRYISTVQNTNREHCFLLEFVENNDPDVFLKDAAVLREWLSALA